MLSSNIGPNRLNFHFSAMRFEVLSTESVHSTMSGSSAQRMV